jgi:hypothetical protein
MVGGAGLLVSRLARSWRAGHRPRCGRRQGGRRGARVRAGGASILSVCRLADLSLCRLSRTSRAPVCSRLNALVRRGGGTGQVAARGRPAVATGEGRRSGGGRCHRWCCGRPSGHEECCRFGKKDGPRIGLGGQMPQVPASCERGPHTSGLAGRRGRPPPSRTTLQQPTGTAGLHRAARTCRGEPTRPHSADPHEPAAGDQRGKSPPNRTGQQWPTGTAGLHPPTRACDGRPAQQDPADLHEPATADRRTRTPPSRTSPQQPTSTAALPEPHGPANADGPPALSQVGRWSGWAILGSNQ